MTRYKCTVCGHEQDYNGNCGGCIDKKIFNSQMQMLEDYGNMATKLNIGIYGDGGCCGCNEQKRRYFCYAIAVLFLLAAIGDFLFQGEDQGEETQAQDNSGSMIGCAIVFFLAGRFCPNGCCNEYKKKNTSNNAAPTNDYVPPTA